MFRDLFLIAELLDSKAESDDVGLERSWLGCPVRSSGLSGLLKSSKKPPLIHQTEARLIRRYSAYLGPDPKRSYSRIPRTYFYLISVRNRQLQFHVAFAERPAQGAFRLGQGSRARPDPRLCFAAPN